MSEKWERNYDDICSDARESNSPTMTWARLFVILRQKFEPVAALPDEKLEVLRARMAKRQKTKTIMYLFDPELCSFCKRAARESGSNDYSRTSLACLACILQGKCFDDAWVVKAIYKAIRSGDYALFRTLIRKGIRDVAAIMRKKADDEREVLP